MYGKKDYYYNALRSYRVKIENIFSEYKKSNEVDYDIGNYLYDIDKYINLYLSMAREISKIFDDSRDAVIYDDFINEFNAAISLEERKKKNNLYEFIITSIDIYIHNNINNINIYLYYDSLMCTKKLFNTFYIIYIELFYRYDYYVNTPKMPELIVVDSLGSVYDKVYNKEENTHMINQESSLYNTLLSKCGSFKYNTMLGENIQRKSTYITNKFDLVDVKFSGDKTILFWANNEKTIVTMDEDETVYDPEKAIMAGYMKRSMELLDKPSRQKSMTKILDKYVSKYNEIKEKNKKHIEEVKARKEKQNKAK